MKHLITIFFISLCIPVISQSIADFESISIPENSYLKDSGSSNGFESGKIILPNEYTDAGSYDFWNGWVVSNIQDTITPGFFNEGASFAGSGVEGSDNYAVSYAPFPVSILLNEESRGNVISGMYVSNNTYAATSMRDGDPFAKKFGGASGDDPDYFLLSFRKWLNGALSSDSISIYLADYRFEDNSEDFILRGWHWVDLSPLGAVDSLQCKLYSSDTGAFGINTPAYFCVDNIMVDQVSSVEDNSESQLNIYPNPCHNFVRIQNLNGRFTIIGMDGRRYIQAYAEKGEAIDISELDSGSYIIHSDSEQGRLVSRFTKI